MVFGKEELNDAFRDKRFPDSVKVELIFDPWSKKELSTLGKPCLEGRSFSHHMQCTVMCAGNVCGV